MASNLERFEALCASLRRNDPETTEVDTYNFPNGYGRRLGDALEGNTHISSMVLWLYHVLAADEDVDSAARLLHYISASVSMRIFQLRYEIDPDPLLRPALLAIAESSHIEELSLRDVHHTEVAPPPDAIALILRRTQSLKKLCLTLGDFDGVASRELVAEAFGANRTLEWLVFYDGSGTHTVESVLLHLGSNPGLRKLTLECGMHASVAQIRALNHFLRTAISLEQLLLRGYVFDKERMKYIVEGLQSSRSLVKLTVDLCTFDLEATKLFHGFMQRVETGATRSSIRELRFDFQYKERMFDDSTTGRAAAAFLTLPDNHHMGSCLASSLQVLVLNAHSVRCDFAGFYDTLAANAFRIRLPCVHHDRISDRASWEALGRCLPKLVYLRDLQISSVDDFVPDEGIIALQEDFVDAMRQNGSLRDVEIRTRIRDNDFFDEAQGRLIRSYCRRNEAIPTLVAIPEPDAAAIALYPKLFAAAKQARRTAPNAILLGLLTAGNDIGPRRNRKRPLQNPSA